MVCSELALELAQPKVTGRWTMEDDQAGAQVAAALDGEGREASGPRSGTAAMMMMVLLRPRDRGRVTG